ncbi:protein kinase 4-like [Hylaeus volcanicus]|uniref:protein kinase 4-like n=1 Tax=Hylaeus volcanicus TaxID=313075 RepID=UPI0023B8741A|nr:protein kinase 4-like [Hylaeus volcanicus]XP_053989721.1 protein kinase 4-like [Hylaeus volcanicus]
MASSTLEEKINKIRQQNEEIRRRHEEVEEDKKNAAKLNALVQMVPSSDWPERKEPPEFSNPPKAKQKPAKEKQEYIPQTHPVEGKRIHSFAQGEGPPPDPKYNFLADSEREEPAMEHSKETSGNRYHNKVIRGNFKKKTGGRESIQKDNKVYKGNYRDESQPGYDAWRAERNRIDEDRISRQRTAEGNWRREWDNDKMHIIDDVTKKATRPALADFTKRDHKDSDRRYYTNNNEYANHTRGGGRGSHRGSSKNFCSSYENRSHNTYDQHRNNTAMPAKIPLSPTSEGRTVIATDKSIKVMVNQSSTSKGPMMSVKVNSPSIVGTGRVGPRQRSRVTYSSQSDAESPMFEAEPFFRQKSFEDKSKGTYFNNQKSPNVKRSQSLRKKDSESKYPYYQGKDLRKEDNDANSQTYHEGEFRSSAQKSFSAKSPKPVRRILHTTKQDSPSENTSRKHETQECMDQDSKNNIVTENNATPQISKSVLPSDQTETLNTESAEQSAETKITNEITLEKETEKLSLSSLSGVENPGEMTEDNTNINSFESKADCSQLLVNNIIEDLQENNTSSVASVSSNVESKEEFVPNESNNVPNDIVNLEKASSSKDNQQLLEQVSKQLVPNESDNVADDIVKLEEADSSKDDQQTLEQVNEELVLNESNNASDGIVELESAPLRNDNQQSSEAVSKQVANDNCDNIKDEVTEQRSSLTTIDQVAPSLAIETHSVIEIKNQSACNESIKETPVVDERTDESIDCSNKNSKDTANCSEVNQENITNGVSVDENSIKKNEKTEEVKDVEKL